MANRFQFEKQILDCVVGGVSALDIPRLNLKSLDESRQFILAYGYDLDDESHREQLWAAHRRAVALIKDQLIEEGEHIPEELYDPAKLTDLCQLLVYASDRNPERRELQKWACAVLRVMHVFVHLRNDLFGAFSDDIQAQILKPLQDVISDDPVAGSVLLGKSIDFEGIKLHKFEIKPFKTSASSVIKLLARPEKVALTLLDKLGVRFVTRTVYDSFRVVRFLVERHIVSYPHIIPDQSNNTLFPLNVFMEVMRELNAKSNAADPNAQEMEPVAVEALLMKRMTEARGRAEYLEKFNEFSGAEHRFIKFINRKLVSVTVGENESRQKFRFFYPYEIQVMDYNTYVNNLSGPMAHDEYKARQRKRARERVLGLRPAEAAKGSST
ncbi:MAG: TIGR04552 family protein [Bdellovibrionaceae bacterium]|nr:TIGR04552 family protein [Pseudobdellovibrionaceae bacterium]